MTKLQKITLCSLLLLMAVLVYVEATKPQPVNWFQSYSRADKIPFGTYVLHHLLTEKLGTQFIEQKRPPFEVLNDTTVTGTYFFANNYIDFDSSELDKILNWASNGNTVFVASHGFSAAMLDTLSLDLGTAYRFDNIKTQPLLELVNKQLAAEKPYHIERDLTIRYFTQIDTASHKVLGITQAFGNTVAITDPKINFIDIPVGDGNLLLHTQPEVLTNYFLLEGENLSYTEGVLSYIDPTRNLYWDNYYKSGKPIELSPLYILLNNKHLKWAYYCILIGALLFVLFEGKRKQRKIPVVVPPANRTLAYTQTIAGMYLDQKDYKAVAEKQITLFKEYLRTQLRIPTEHVNSRFLNSVAARSGNTLEVTKELFTFIERLQKRTEITPEMLLKLNQHINSYKNTADGKS